MAAPATTRRTYDPDIRRMVAEGRGDDIVRTLKIPRSTVSGWRRRPLPPVVSVGPRDQTTEELRAHIGKLERRIEVLTRIMVLLLTLVRVAKLTLNNTRVPDPEDRGRLLRVIDGSEGVLPRRSALRIVGLRHSRYGQWKREAEMDCPVADLSRCPRTQPGQLTAEEVGKMHTMVTAPEYRPVPTSTLAILAQRLGQVFASTSTWCRHKYENFNEAVDQLVAQGMLKRILAQTDVRESNSLIERFWLQAKQGWLFLHDLDNIATVRRLVDFYVTEYKTVLPHSAHAGRTPDEVYFHQKLEVPDQLAEARKKARAARLKANRRRECHDCVPGRSAA